jgi:survival-of-motor-neuron-related-splicing factor 30
MAAEKTEKKAQKEEDRKSRVAEQNSRQSSWQSFAKKSTKKGVHIPGVKGESLFKTPDNPYGRGECLAPPAPACTYH